MASMQKSYRLNPTIFDKSGFFDAFLAPIDEGNALGCSNNLLANSKTVCAKNPTTSIQFELLINILGALNG